MKKIVVLFIDAFSHNYINPNDTPFLSKQDVRPLTPVFGFKQLAAAFTGLGPFSTGLFAEYYYDPSHSPCRWTRRLPTSVLSMVDAFARPSINLVSHLMSWQKRFTPKYIPLKVSKSFVLDDVPYPSPCLITSLLQEKRLSHRFVFHPEVKSNETAFNLLKTFHDSDQSPDFLFVHFPELDPITHALGMKSNPVRESVQKVDSIVGRAMQLFNKDSCFIVFSDHGMFDVKGHVNILSRVREVGCLGKDFVVFLDSIMARFWVFKDANIKRITRLLSTETAGKIIVSSKGDLVNRFGHIMFLCSPEHTIFPNYYDWGVLPKAMHGYYVETQSESPLDGILLADNLPMMPSKNRFSMTDIASILKMAIQSL